MHGNEPLGFYVAEKLKDTPAITTINLHPEAVAAGQRLLGDQGELGGRFPGNMRSPNIEDRAAYLANYELSQVERAYREYGFCNTIVDIHSCDIPNSNYTVTGRLIYPETLAIAQQLGRSTMLVMDEYPFFEYWPNTVLLESQVEDDIALAAQTEYLASQLRFIHGLGKAGLRDVYDALDLESMTYYRYSKSIMLVRNGVPNEAVLEVLDELEEIDTTARFDPVTISDRVAAALGITAGSYLKNTWGHHNMSREYPEAGISREGVVRRECFGDLLRRVAPPFLLNVKDPQALRYFRFTEIEM
jgi:hypothetical protein